MSPDTLVDTIFNGPGPAPTPAQQPFKLSSMRANEHDHGLSWDEARSRLRSDGPNRLPQPPARTVLHIGLEVLREPMFQLLMLAGLIYIALGDIGEALMLLCFVQISILIAVVQEKRSENALQALRNLATPRALVIREGSQHLIDSRELVRGDVLVLTEGDRVAADAVLMAAYHLQVDESLLTGESVPVVKSLDADASQGHVYSGTMVTAGNGMARVTATGLMTELGRIGRSLGEIKEAPTRLHAETRKFVRIFGTVGLVLSVMTTLVMGVTQGDWLQGLLSGITLAMSILPEEFAVVLTVFLAMGAWRISHAQVLTRRSAAIEGLGAITVLCADKTGTLTENQMSVAGLWQAGHLWRRDEHDLTESFHALMETAVLASKPQASDPMERAIHALGEQYTEHANHTQRGWQLQREYAISSELLAMSHLWRDHAGQYVVACKGAPEAVIGLCKLPDHHSREVRLAIDGFARQGMRVLGVARGTQIGSNAPSDQREIRFEFMGLVALADPLRSEVPDAVRQCHQAGIRVVMITGDHPNTAFAIARESGITQESDNEHVVMTGNELLSLSDDALQARVASVKVFARIRPEQKLRIVMALQSVGETVAMTGDGVNDAPALKAAHIGIAMGGRGTDVAREAAALVLLRDDFASIVKAIAEGRRIYANIKRALAYVIAIHIPIAGLAMLPLFFGQPMLFFPAHIAFLELIVDPTSCFVFESQPGDASLMRAPPRPKNASLFSPSLLWRSAATGAVLLAALIGLYLSLQAQGASPDTLRAACFAGLVLGGIVITLGTLARMRIAAVPQALANRSFQVITAVSLAMLALVLLVPTLRELFQFEMLF